MNANDNLRALDQMAMKPKDGTEDFRKWVEQEDFSKFLENSTNDEIPVYISWGQIYVYSVILPTKSISGNYVDDLLGWQCGPSNSWGHCYSFTRKGTPKNIRISGPFETSSSKILKKASPLTFFRSFEGSIGSKAYIEVSQFFTHINGLHFEGSRNAYSRLDENGDIEDVVKIFMKDGNTLVTVKKEVMDFHLFSCKSALVRLFDVTRSQDPNSWFGGSQETLLGDKGKEIFARKGTVSGGGEVPIAGWLRGFQIIRNNEPRKNMLKMLTGDSSDKKYEEFIALDWKHGKVTECSCDPKKLDSYFSETGKPWQVSPVFFKPDVLLKYKQDKEKYKLGPRSISCRGSWHLETYDINDAGQVHTYLVYLGSLPHKEQLCWKAYNEAPKGGISKRALTTDIKGDWDRTYDPLRELLKALEKLQMNKEELWAYEGGGWRSAIELSCLKLTR